MLPSSYAEFGSFASRISHCLTSLASWLFISESRGRMKFDETQYAKSVTCVTLCLWQSSCRLAMFFYLTITCFVTSSFQSTTEIVSKQVQRLVHKSFYSEKEVKSKQSAFWEARLTSFDWKSIKRKGIIVRSGSRDSYETCSEISLCTPSHLLGPARTVTLHRVLKWWRLCFTFTRKSLDGRRRE